MVVVLIHARVCPIWARDCVALVPFVLLAGTRPSRLGDSHLREIIVPEHAHALTLISTAAATRLLYLVSTKALGTIRKMSEG